MNILILMSDTGGGHRAAAEALIEALEQLAPGRCQAEMVDFIARCTPFPLNRVGRLYRPWVNYAARLWSWMYYLSDRPRLMKALLKLLIPLLARRKLVALLHRRSPDLVVSVHPLANHLAIQALAPLDRRIPVITVVTDLVTAHTTWFSPDVDLCIVPSEGAFQYARRAGMPREKLRVVGLPVSTRFLEQRGDKGELRRTLGLDEDRWSVLLVGGGEGMGRLGDIARGITSSGLDLQLMVIAGRNEALRRRLASARWPVPTHVYGFVTNMPELMAAADLIVTKAGPGTVTEALTCGLPVILSGFVPGQEEGNVQFVVEGGAGLLAETPEKIVAALRELLRPGNDALDHMAANACRLARPTAGLDVARLILDMAPDSSASCVNT